MQGALEMATGKGAGIAKSTILALFLEAGNPRITRTLGNGHRKRSGYCKIGNFGAFVGFLPFRRPWKPEIQEIQRTLEMASGKGVLWWGSFFRSLHYCLEA